MRGWLGCALVAALIAAIVVGIFGWGVATYSSLARSQIQVDSAWAQVENVYQRRLDLLPSLVEKVKGVAGFERETYTAVAHARSNASQLVVTPGILDDPARFQVFQQAQGELTGALSRLLVTVESYPDLEADESFLDLQSQLESAENRISVERRRFNEAVREYNTAIRVFPASMLAGTLGFSPKPFFASDPAAERPPTAEF